MSSSLSSHIISSLPAGRGSLGLLRLLGVPVTLSAEDPDVAAFRSRGLKTVSEPLQNSDEEEPGLLRGVNLLRGCSFRTVPRGFASELRSSPKSLALGSLGAGDDLGGDDNIG